MHRVVMMRCAMWRSMSETAMFQRFRGIWILPMRDGVIPG
ncbi:hypothetical protein BBJK_02327 [Bifidobacterium bifidum LMG 13195]|uniref:Uncharacterized protein n=1 Tax=Bifidobacterium bifidum LMG 13195 TaxID=1207542 RepID=A0A286TEB9_BIFBI|nr:hypothetical protein BBJK_02327 [Bifidobacterium bifidum LMG 13195]